MHGPSTHGRPKRLLLSWFTMVHRGDEAHRMAAQSSNKMAWSTNTSRSSWGTIRCLSRSTHIFCTIRGFRALLGKIRGSRGSLTLFWLNSTVIVAWWMPIGWLGAILGSNKSWKENRSSFMIWFGSLNFYWDIFLARGYKRGGRWPRSKNKDSKGFQEMR